VALFDENMKLYLTLEKFAYFKPGIGSGSVIGSVSASGSAFVKKAGSGSAYDECGSETLEISRRLKADNKYLNGRKLL
jgi:hypothetical protein